jgi:hypothetical protein
MANKKYGSVYFSTTRILISITVSIVMLFAVYVVYYSRSTPGPVNTDPRLGQVFIGGGDVVKFCDGTTLIYDGQSTTTISNSSECQP